MVFLRIFARASYFARFAWGFRIVDFASCAVWLFLNASCLSVFFSTGVTYGWVDAAAKTKLGCCARLAWSSSRRRRSLLFSSSCFKDWITSSLSLGLLRHKRL